MCFFVFHSTPRFSFFFYSSAAYQTKGKQNVWFCRFITLSGSLSVIFSDIIQFIWYLMHMQLYFCSSPNMSEYFSSVVPINTLWNISNLKLWLKIPLRRKIQVKVLFFFSSAHWFSLTLPIEKTQFKGLRSITAQWKTRQGTHSPPRFCFQTPPPPESKGKPFTLTETVRSRHFIANIIAYEPFLVIHYEPFWTNDSLDQID